MGLDTTYLRLVEIVFMSDNGPGYVMDFSNSTLQEFVIDKVNIDIYSDKYAGNGNSKMKRLKTLLRNESNKTCGYLLLHLLKYKEINYCDRETSILSNQYKKLLTKANLLSGRKVNQKKTPVINPKKDYNLKYDYEKLLTDLYELSSIKSSQERGYKFEDFLTKLFTEFHLQPRESFKVNLTLEQIDGSFILDNETFLVEAKYKKNKIPTDDLILFNSKIRGFSRGLFITLSELNDNFSSLHVREASVKFICITVKELMEVLYQKRPLDSFLRSRLRFFNETGTFYQNEKQ